MLERTQESTTSTPSGGAPAQAGASPKVQLKGMGYEQGAAALKPSLQLKASGFGDPDPRGKIATLHPVMQEKVRRLIDEAHQRGLNIWLFEGMRSIARQNDLYAQGRTKPGQIVTWVRGGGSYHNYGLAGDFVFHGGSGPWGEEHNWSALGAAGEAAGLKWGGSFGDRPHFQIRGFSIDQLKAWHAQGGMDYVWQQVSGGGGGAPAPQPQPDGNTASGTYTVRSGDTLGAIAERLLGEHSRWREIASANGISDPRRLQVGQVLVIPGLGGGAAPAPSQPEAPQPAPPTSSGTYTVRAGDTLGGIADRLLGDHGRWREIADANGISDPRKLQVGQVLRIPGQGGGQPSSGGPQSSGGGSRQYTVQRGDTLGGIAQRLLGSWSQWRTIAQANGISDPKKLQVGQVLTIPGLGGGQPSNDTSAPSGSQPGAGGDLSYTVRAGDTLGALAQRFLGSSSRWREIASANGISDPTKLQVGQVLRIPGAGPAPSQPAPPQHEPAPQPTPTPEPGGSDAPVTTGNGVFLITDPNALLRHDPPNLSPRGGSVPAGTRVRVIQTVQQDGKVYVKVREVLPEGQGGQPRDFGWTVRTNLNGYEGGGGPKDYDASMTVDDPIVLTGLGGVDRQMAVIYNGKGRFLKEQADALGIPVSVAAAVLKAESGGKGFAGDNRMIIRFENHIFWDKWGQSHAGTYNQHFQHGSGQRWKNHKFRPNASGPWLDCHSGQSREYEVLQFARGLSDEQALQSISMGAAQIMGFNHAGQGYPSARAMFDDFKTSIRPQLDGLFTFIRNKPTCINGLREGNYVKFATGYNGSGQAQAYANIILNAKAAFERVASGRKHS